MASNSENLPVLKRKELTFSVLSIIYKRGETRARTNLTHFNKFSLRLSNQSNASGAARGSGLASSLNVQDLGYWQNEFVLRQAEMIKTLKLLTTLVALISIFPNPFPGQEWNESVEYIEPYFDHDDGNGGQQRRNPAALNSTNSPRLDPPLVISNLISSVQSLIDANHVVPAPVRSPAQNNKEDGQEQLDDYYYYIPFTLTPTQTAFSRRCIAVLSEITMDYNRNKELCQSALNRMHLFSPAGQNIAQAGFDDDDGNDDDLLNGTATDLDETDTDTEGSDVESHLLNGDSGTKGNAMLKNENRMIQQSLKQSQQAINSAYQSTDSLARQRDMFDSIIARVGSITSRFPGMTGMMDGIQNRRNRDNCILATLVAFLMFLTFLYVQWKHS